MFLAKCLRLSKRGNLFLVINHLTSIYLITYLFIPSLFIDLLIYYLLLLFGIVLLAL